MSGQEQKEVWHDLKEIWKNYPQSEKINIEMSQLIIDFKGKISQFEKDSIKSDVTKIKASWSQFESKISRFEKDSINKDVAKITSSLRNFINLFRKKK